MGKDPRQELFHALKSLREDLREVTEGFLFRMEGEIEDLCSCLQKMPAAGLHEITPPLLRKTRELKLKPAKGRLKDLKRIDALLESLLDSVAAVDDQESKPRVRRKKAPANVDEKTAPEEPRSACGE